MVEGDFGKLEKLLTEMTQKVVKGEIEGDNSASSLFSTYIDTLLNTGLFSVKDWPLDWQKKHLFFFSVFGESQEAIHVFLKQIKRKMREVSKHEPKEVLHYLYLGFLFYARMDRGVSVLEYSKTLLRQYPKHPDFFRYHALSLSREGLHKSAVEEMKLAMQYAEKNEIYVTDLLAVETKYLEELIGNRHFNEAEYFLNRQEEYYQAFFGGAEWALIHRQLILFKSRLSDHRSVGRVLEKIGETITEKTEGERRRLVEVLGVFSAILAFIFMNIQIATKFTFYEAFWLMLTMGDLLLIFAITLSYVFNRSKKAHFFYHTRFWILLVLFTFLALVGVELHLKNAGPVEVVEKVIVENDQGKEIEKEEDLDLDEIPQEESKKEEVIRFQKLFIPKK